MASPDEPQDADYAQQLLATAYPGGGLEEHPGGGTQISQEEHDAIKQAHADAAKTGGQKYANATHVYLGEDDNVTTQTHSHPSYGIPSIESAPRTGTFSVFPQKAKEEATDGGPGSGPQKGHEEAARVHSDLHRFHSKGYARPFDPNNQQDNKLHSEHFAGMNAHKVAAEKQQIAGANANSPDYPFFASQAVSASNNANKISYSK